MQVGRVRAARSSHTVMPVLGRFCPIMLGLMCKILVKVLQMHGSVSVCTCSRACRMCRQV